MDIIFKGRHTDVLDRFRRHATAKLAKIGKLDPKAIRIDVEVTTERNPRQSGRRERVELTISSPGPTIRAEAAAEDRYVAVDMAFSKLESRLRRAGDRRKCRHGAHAAVRLIARDRRGEIVRVVVDDRANRASVRQWEEISEEVLRHSGDRNLIAGVCSTRIWVINLPGVHGEIS